MKVVPAEVGYTQPLMENFAMLSTLPPLDFLREDVTLLNYKGEDWSKYEAAILVEQVRG